MCSSPHFLLFASSHYMHIYKDVTNVYYVYYVYYAYLCWALILCVFSVSSPTHPPRQQPSEGTDITHIFGKNDRWDRSWLIGLTPLNLELLCCNTVCTSIHLDSCRGEGNWYKCSSSTHAACCILSNKLSLVFSWEILYLLLAPSKLWHAMLAYK